MLISIFFLLFIKKQNKFSNNNLLYTVLSGLKLFCTVNDSDTYFYCKFGCHGKQHTDTKKCILPLSPLIPF